MNNQIYFKNPEISDAINSLNAVKQHFNNVSDPDLIESMIYQMKALEAKIAFLTKEAKAQKNVS